MRATLSRATEKRGAVERSTASHSASYLVRGRARARARVRVRMRARG